MNVMQQYTEELADAAGDADRTDYILRAMYHFANRGRSVDTVGMTDVQLRMALVDVLV